MSLLVVVSSGVCVVVSITYGYNVEVVNRFRPNGLPDGCNLLRNIRNDSGVQYPQEDSV